MRQGVDSEGPFGPTREEQQALQDKIAAELEAQRRALNFLQTVAVNLDNGKLTDAAFRDFIRNSLEGMPGIDYVKPEKREEFPILPAESTGYVD